MSETHTAQRAIQWWEAFPAPRAKFSEITAENVMNMFDDMDIKPAPRAFLLIDLRRTDWEVGPPFFFSNHHFSQKGLQL